ncbi:MAG: hypothetical protein M3Y74_06505 [Chloroflexota bacterium]|nr:hypothetical protein [Chloroflexota bacterium]
MSHEVDDPLPGLRGQGPPDVGGDGLVGGSGLPIGGEQGVHHVDSPSSFYPL